MIGVAVSSDDDFGASATLSYIEDTNLLNRFAGTDAPGAQDAQTHVVLNHHVTGSLVASAERELPSGSDRDIVSDYIFLELVPGRGPTAVGQVISRIALQQEVEDAPAVGDGCLVLRLDDHAVYGLDGTGGLQLVGFGDGDKADPTVPGGRQLGIPTEGGDVDSPSTCRVEDGITCCDRECATVDCE